MKRIILHNDNYRVMVCGKIIRHDPDFFDFIQDDQGEYIRRCYNDYRSGLEHYNNFKKLPEILRWKPHYYPKSHETTLYSIWFLGRLVGKDVARMIGKMIWESRYDFIWENEED